MRGTGRRTVLAATLLAGTLVGMPAGAEQEGSGALDLVNMEHVYNFNPGGSSASRGTDLDFWTATVPHRDYETGQLLDADGNPLPLEEPPVMVERDFAVVGSESRGGYVFDITDPAAPQLVSLVTCAQIRNDPAVKRFTDTEGNERWLLALAKDDFGGSICLRTPRIGPNTQAGIAVFDVTDPYAWAPMYSVQFTGGAHNFTFHPTKPFGWASNGDLPGALPPPSAGFDMIPIIDFTDPDAPTVTQVDIPIGSPHDLDFSLDGTRAYVAAENHYEIFDTTDPKNPVVVSRTTINPGTYAHGAFVTPDKDVMITNNESLALGGFFVGGTGVCPGEGLGFYDIAGPLEQAPALVGYYVPQVVEPLAGYCTSHFGKVAPNGDVITIGWYTLGARVVDFTNPSVPTEVASALMTDANVWSAKFYKGPYLYTGDINRGFDVFRWTGDGPAPWEAAS